MLEKSKTFTEEYRYDANLYFVNKPGSYALLSGMCATYYRDLFVACGCFCLCNGAFDPGSHEGKRQLFVLLWQLFWNSMSQDKYRHLIFVVIHVPVGVCCHGVGTSAYHHCACRLYCFLKHLCFSQCFKIRIQTAHITISVIHKPVQ